jgi:hypothetical protein
MDGVDSAGVVDSAEGASAGVSVMGAGSLAKARVLRKSKADMFTSRLPDP